MKIQVFPLDWEGRKRIGIKPMGFDKAFPGMMKQVRGSRWTPDVRCWHIPYDPEAYGQNSGFSPAAEILKQSLRKEDINLERKIYSLIK